MKILLSCVLLLSVCAFGYAEDRRPIRFVDPTIKVDPEKAKEDNEPPTLEKVDKRVRHLERRMGPPAKNTVHELERQLEILQRAHKELQKEVQRLRTDLRLRR